MKASTLNFKQLLHLHQWAWARIIRATELPDSSLNCLRILLPALYLLFYMPSYSWIAGMPDAWFDPPPLSIAAGLQAFPPALFFQLTETLLVLCAVAIMRGFHPRLFGLAFCLCHLLLTSFEYSFGKIDHVAHLFLIAFFSLSLDNWGQPTPNQRWRLPIPGSTLLAVLLAFGMFTAGFEKTIRWVDFNTDTSGFLSWYFSSYYNLGREALLSPYITLLPKIALELLDYSAVVFEMVPFICLLLGTRAWIGWCAVACLFHAGTTMMLNIAFPYQLFGYLPFLIPACWLAKLNIHSNKWLALLLVFTAYRIAGIWSANCPLLRDVILPTHISKLYFDLFIWLALAAMGAYTAYRWRCPAPEAVMQTPPPSV